MFRQHNRRPYEPDETASKKGDISCVRLKALVIQGGEIPPPVKPNQQPVLSLGVETVRSDLSVDKGVCEPQCESVKPISPVNFGNAEVETVP